MSKMRKITISAPEKLIEFVDERAERTHTSRSRVISRILDAFRKTEMERLAAEGYQFYADALAAFAEVSAKAFSEAIHAKAHEKAWEHDRETR